jgi:hypothetical protein
MYCAIEFDTSRVHFWHLTHGVGHLHDGVKPRTPGKSNTGAEVMQAQHASVHAAE